MNACKLFFILLLSLCIVSCQEDSDVKNTHTISGKIGYPGEVFVPSGFTVDLILDDHVIATSDHHDGLFSFSDLEEGKTYYVVPRAEDSNNGVSALDKVQIEKYLLDELTLDPYQKLAADVNRDNHIDQADIDGIVNCIISQQCFSWRFATADYDGNGIGSHDPYSVPNLSSDVEVILVPIKIGDVNGTIRPH